MGWEATQWPVERSGVHCLRPTLRVEMGWVVMVRVVGERTRYEVVVAAREHAVRNVTVKRLCLDV